MLSSTVVIIALIFCLFVYLFLVVNILLESLNATS